jgi:hypothetical protein
VNRKVTREGGRIVYGWAIWEWPRVFLEAEHHAVWSDGDRLVDVTPHVPASYCILFLPDPQRVYDYHTGKRFLNVKRSLGEFPSVEGWIEATDGIQRYMEGNSNGSIVTMDRQVAAALYQEARMTATTSLAPETARADGLALLERMWARRSTPPRHLMASGPTAEEIRMIVRAAARAPDHMQLKPFRFVVIEPDDREALADVFVEAERRAACY